jgi:thiol-disulfide isomerase/thioredoxin
VVLKRSVLLAFVMTTIGLSAAVAADVNSIKSGLSNLRSLSPEQRGPRTGELAHDIATLPPGKDKLGLALALAHLSTEGDPGRDNLQAVTNTLAQAVKENPVPPGKNDAPAGPYVELAALARYEGMNVSADVNNEAQYKAATQKLVDEDKAIEQADFTLQDFKGKKWTLSSLRGKVVVVNFWATWCPPCRIELPALDRIADHFSSQDLVVLTITDEDPMKVFSLLNGKMHFTILFDPNHKAATAFHVTGLPKTFVFDRDGKLAAEAMDGRTPQQFLAMLQRAGVKMQ